MITCFPNVASNQRHPLRHYMVECTEVIVGYGAWAGAELGNPPVTVMHGRA